MVSVEDVLKKTVKEKGIQLEDSVLIRLEDLVDAGVVENDLEFLTAAQGLSKRLYVIGPEEGLVIVPGKVTLPLSKDDYSVCKAQLRHFSKDKRYGSDIGGMYA
jgi:hypothetical protein